MADMTDDDFILDELASAYLDDEVTADERAAIEANPRALARVAALRAVRVTLQADVGEVDDDRLEAALATALAAHRVAPGGASTATVGPEAGPSGDPSTGAPVEPPVDLAAARRRHAGRIWKPVLAVAGAAAIGVGAISGVANLAADGGGDDSASELAVPLAASDAASTDTNADLADDDAAGGAAPAASEAGTDPAQSGGDATQRDDLGDRCRRRGELARPVDAAGRSVGGRHDRVDRSDVDPGRRRGSGAHDRATARSVLGRDRTAHCSSAGARGGELVAMSRPRVPSRCRRLAGHAR